MPRLQDILFGILGVSLVVMLMFNISIAVLAMVGAFACGSVTMLAGMWPAPDEPLGQRLFTSTFLAIVLSSLVLIVPGTFGTLDADMENTVLVIAAMPPLAAIGFELLRTPRLIQSVRRHLGRR